jgi:hypothetical protein
LLRVATEIWKLIVLKSFWLLAIFSVIIIGLQFANFLALDVLNGRESDIIFMLASNYSFITALFLLSIGGVSTSFLGSGFNNILLSIPVHRVKILIGIIIGVVFTAIIIYSLISVSSLAIIWWARGYINFRFIFSIPLFSLAFISIYGFVILINIASYKIMSKESIGEFTVALYILIISPLLNYASETFGSGSGIGIILMKTVISVLPQFFTMMEEMSRYIIGNTFSGFPFATSNMAGMAALLLSLYIFNRLDL